MYCFPLPSFPPSLPKSLSLYNSCAFFVCAFFQSVVHEVSDHQSTFGLILEQLQHVQELSSQPDSIKKTHDRIKQRQENLEKLLQQLKGSSHILRSRCKSAGSTPDPMEVCNENIVPTSENFAPAQIS